MVGSNRKVVQLSPAKIYISMQEGLDVNNNYQRDRCRVSLSVCPGESMNGMDWIPMVYDKCVTLLGQISELVS